MAASANMQLWNKKTDASGTHEAGECEEEAGQRGKGEEPAPAHRRHHEHGHQHHRTAAHRPEKLYGENSQVAQSSY